jgi:NhaA family Na+:H+ antiporter
VRIAPVRTSWINSRLGDAALARSDARRIEADTHQRRASIEVRQLWKTDGMTDIALTPLSAADHARGPHGAPLTLIEYGDFECPYCSDAHAAVHEIEQRFAGRLHFVFRQFPLREIHPHAEAAAQAAEAAGAQGRFWQMYDELFAHAKALGGNKLAGYAKAAGVPDLERFAAELATGRYRSDLDAAIERAQASGVEGTPMFFINGQPFEDEPSIEALGAALEAALGEQNAASSA